MTERAIGEWVQRGESSFDFAIDDETEVRVWQYGRGDEMSQWYLEFIRMTQGWSELPPFGPEPCAHLSTMGEMNPLARSEVVKTEALRLARERLMRQVGVIDAALGREGLEVS